MTPEEHAAFRRLEAENAALREQLAATLAEPRELRMLKVQRKISSTFRSLTGAVAFCRIRGMLSTWCETGAGLLTLLHALFPDGSLLLPATI